MLERIQIFDAAQKISEADYTGLIQAGSDNSSLFARDVSKAEFGMAEHFGCDYDPNMESHRVDFPVGSIKHSTFSKLMDFYNNSCSTKPDALLVDYLVAEDEISAIYWLRLGAMGRNKDAVTLESRYFPGPRTRGNSTFRELKRESSRPKLTRNPDWVSRNTTDSNEPLPVKSNVMGNSKRNGRFGTRPF